VGAELQECALPSTVQERAAPAAGLADADDRDLGVKLAVTPCLVSALRLQVSLLEDRADHATDQLPVRDA
jgi:hypothetical protein